MAWTFPHPHSSPCVNAGIGTGKRRRGLGWKRDEKKRELLVRLLYTVCLVAVADRRRQAWGVVWFGDGVGRISFGYSRYLLPPPPTPGPPRTLFLDED